MNTIALDEQYRKILARRFYLSRLVGYVLGFIPIGATFYRHGVGAFSWISLFLVCLIWPSLAYLIEIHSDHQSKAELKNFNIDAWLMGMSLPMMSFSFPPSMTIVEMYLLTIIAAAGFKYLVRNILFFILGGLILIPFIEIHAKYEANPFIAISCIPPLFLYPMVIAFAMNRVAKEYNKARWKIESQKEKLEDAYEQIIRQRDILDNLSNIDGLTGIPNRRRFDEYLNLQWQNAVRSKSPLSAIMIDIDHFKAFNDCFGHLNGDESLKKIAKTISGTVKRPNDMVARYGGEEFVCLLPVTDLQGAVGLAEKMRMNVMALAIPHVKSPIVPYVTISLGIASITPDKESSPSVLIETADKALYEAKNSARNCVRIGYLGNSTMDTEQTAGPGALFG
jgi:diguanylate cyclase (GGDEF)-like protein